MIKNAEMYVPSWVPPSQGLMTTTCKWTRCFIGVTIPPQDGAHMSHHSSEELQALSDSSSE